MSRSWKKILKITTIIGLSAASYAQAQELLPEIEVSADLAGGRSGQGQIGGGTFIAPESSSERNISGARINDIPVTRPGEVLESVPGLIITQHSGEGKANQYFLRGVNLDHGTDLAISVDGMPVNMRTHGHGQGYADLSFLIPELVSWMQVRKGPYFASEGDFSSVGSVHINYIDRIDRNLWQASLGSFGYGRALAIVSEKVGEGQVLAAGEATFYNGPWDVADRMRKANGVVRYSQGTAENGFSVTGMGYINRWNSTDQIAERAVTGGLINRFGSLDSSDGGNSHRFSLSGRWSSSDVNGATRVNAYVINQSMNLFSNFTYFQNDPVNGDQFKQFDQRTLVGGNASHTFKSTVWGRSMETEIGVQTRYDNISLGLENTLLRSTLSVVRHDDVKQASAALYVENRFRWTDWFRTSIGLRGDAYHVNVNSNLGVNSGSASDALVSPKFGMVFGPWAKTELFFNIGQGFHSNDARGATITLDPVSGAPVPRVPLLVRSNGAEVGIRSQFIDGLDTSVTFWGLEFDSEILFVGDAGTTEPSRPSRRYGVEIVNHYKFNSWLSFDVDVAWSHARFTDFDPAGSYVPGAPTFVASASFTVGDEKKGWFGGMRLRYFGVRPLIEDNSAKANATAVVNARVGYAFDNGMKFHIDALNLFNAKANQIDYFYESQLPGEPAPVADRHFKPIEPFALRATLAGRF